MRFLVAALIVGAALAGCLAGDDDSTDASAVYPLYKPVDGKVHYEYELPSGHLFHAHWAPGGESKVWNKEGDGDVSVTLPEYSILLTPGASEGSWAFSLDRDLVLAPGDEVLFIAPPSATDLALTINGEATVLNGTDVPGYETPTGQFLSGENIVELMAYQEANFPHREPGLENYGKSIEYFAAYFEELGYEVEVDPYGTGSLTDTAGCSPVGLNTLCPESLANVVAVKPGNTRPDEIIFVAGGHFDMVPQTTHAAFDDTSGTIMTLELARAMAPLEFDRTIAFGLWGGEENGLLGSNFWVKTNQDAAATQILSYWNLDVVGMSWPAPVVQPDPIMIAAGPDVPSVSLDGTSVDPVSLDLLDFAAHLQQDWFGFPDEHFLYEGVASGQVAGYAGVNAQSDHTAFIAGGVPSYFIFNADALAADNPVALHTEADTLTNMTKYALYGGEFDLDDPTWISEEDRLAAEAALARSFEAVMFFPFYHAILLDLGEYDHPSIAGTLPP
ncbi:MAG: M28 family peptidase [Thermoplasmatota archaeon]